MTTALHTPSDVAQLLGHSADYWQRKARAKQVPHRRLGRSIRFTDDDIAQILRAAAVPATDPLASQTAGSRSRATRSPR